MQHTKAGAGSPSLDTATARSLSTGLNEAGAAMTTILRERLAAEVTEDVVVFAIGMRINRWWKVWKWFPIFLEMPKMLREQEVDPAIGQLSSRLMFGMRNIGVLQHWRSAEHLHAYAHGAGRLHLAAWQRFNARIGTSGDVGIWHETYVVPARNVESIFVNMPRYGLGIAGEVFSAKGDRASAKKRLRRVVVGEKPASANASGDDPIS